MSPAAQLASIVAQKFVKSAVPDLSQLCKELGLRIREVAAQGFDGALIRSKSAQKGIIAVKAAIREASRKRFTIAHEIGHFIIPHHRLLPNTCEARKVESFDMRLKGPELEANEFAAELLLPSHVVRSRFNLRDFSLADISGVAEEFGTSLTATARAYLSLTDLPCALVWSTANQAKWFVRSDSFRFFLPLNDLPTHRSFASRLFRGEVAPTGFELVPSDAWLEGKSVQRVETLLEHSMPLANYGAVLSFLWAYKVDPTIGTSEEDSLLEEFDPNDFTINRRCWPL